MENNFSLTKLFVSKEVTIFNQQEGWRFNIILKTIRDFYEDEDWNSTYHLWTLPVTEYQRIISFVPIKTNFDFLIAIFFILGQFKEYNKTEKVFEAQLKKLIPSIEIDFKEKNIVISRKPLLIMTEEIWDYIIYILKLSYGEKVEAPIVFTDPEAKAFYLAQKEAEREVQRIKSQSANKDKDSLMKTLLTITYAFPSLTFDYLLNQTLAQIHWLAKYAAASVSYEVNAQALAAGNMKKGKKLDFFIK